MRLSLDVIVILTISLMAVALGRPQLDPGEGGHGAWRECDAAV